MDFSEMIKSSGRESAAFAKRNAGKFAVIGDLQKARDGCSVTGAAAMIAGLIVPLQK